MVVSFTKGDPRVERHPYAPTLQCPACHAPVIYSDDALIASFSGAKFVCVAGHFSRPFDVISFSISEHFMGSYMVLVGAQGEIFTHPIEPSSQYSIDLHDYGIPRDSRIFDVNLTANADFGTHEIFGNTRRRKPKSAFISHHTDARTPHKDPFVGQPKVVIAVMWINTSSLRPGMLSLVTAFEAFEDGDLEAAIIPANVATEAALHAVVSAEYSAHLGAAKLTKFLTTHCSYATQLDALLPYIVARRSFVPLNDTIVQELKKLAAVRNEIAHEGKAKNELTTKSVARHLAATLIAYHYFETLLLRPHFMTLAGNSGK